MYAARPAHETEEPVTRPRTAQMIACVAAAGVLVGAGMTSARAAAVRTVYVTATDDKRIPVRDLTAADFRIKEDGKTRDVVSVLIPEIPLSVVLMIDDSGLGLQSIREGAAAFVTRLKGRAEIAIISTAGRNTLLSDYTTSTPTLVAALNKTYARNANGAFLLDGLVEAMRTFTAREARRPVIVTVATEGAEFSDVLAEDVLNTLLRSRAQLYVVRLGQPVVGQSNPAAMERGQSLADEAIRLNAVLGQGPPRSGGRSEQLIQHTAIPRVMDQIATELVDQYAVTYSVADPSAREVKLEVETTRRGVRVRAPTRVGTGVR